VTGSVALVGAGPGDPDLLTLRAAARLRDAELVLYDALVDERLLTLAPHARRFFVGKRAGRHALEQRAIERLMIRAARRGERVVRLKCGDPFVLGRGGEEALALAAAGIAYEIVPGVSAAVAAPALAGIPVTHRGLASGFVVVSGHRAELVDAIAPAALTVVVLMAMRTRAEIAARMIARGWAKQTPAAIVQAAATAQQTRWIGTLAELGVAEIDVELQGVLVIGDVVSVAARIENEHTYEHQQEHDHEREVHA
jgi:uroporphyrin-III C-methyltransferase